MSLSLGEKLREAREERGFTIADVAEQTRISSLYLESIENDDYRILPGGIFNKGFVKSYAKFVGINEAEALQDYSALLAQTSSAEDEGDLKVYRPEVLTDDRSTSSMVPTVILAAVILGIMTAGILFLVSYLRQPADVPAANTTAQSNNSNSAEPTPETTPASTGVPEMATVKVEFKALSEPVALTSTNDGKVASSVVTPGTSTTFEPKEALKLSYSKSLANVVQLSINGKAITLPAQPLVPKRNAIEFEINKSNLAQIWSSGAISTEVPPAAPVAVDTTTVPANTAANTANTALPVLAPTPVTAPASTPARPTQTPKPTAAANTAANTAPKPTPDKKPAATPAAQPKPPAANKP
ncbi:MAG TPA: helix-turn-helix domain-containing protein [Pyrinomonadaceae bacterium]|nr:helix-turn-helix domain-containing protein [Pyrinomonadaceae bacterium]